MPVVLRILRPPLGAAPEHVRRAWVGLELPLLAEQPIIVRSVLDSEPITSRWQALWGRLTGRYQKQLGYAVLVSDALEILERSRPLEAAWWRQNAPHLIAPGRVFVFDRACGERVEVNG